MKLLKALLLSALLTLVLNGCATTNSNQPVSDKSHTLWQQRHLQLENLDHWDIRGRIALFVADDIYNLSIQWHRNADLSTVTLEAPLGQGLIQISQNSHEAVLITSDGDKHQGTNAEQVLLQATGWNIPIDGLSSWVIGINHPLSNFQKSIDSDGKAQQLQQDNWQIFYLNYSKSKLDSYKDFELPQKIYIKRTNTEKRLALKLVIDQWHPLKMAQQPDLFPNFSE